MAAMSKEEQVRRWRISWAKYSANPKNKAKVKANRNAWNRCAKSVMQFTGITRPALRALPPDVRAVEMAKARVRISIEDAQGIAAPIESTVVNSVSAPKMSNVYTLPTVSRKGDFEKYKPMTTRKTVKVSGKKVLEGIIYAVYNPDLESDKKCGKTFPQGMAKILEAARRFGRAEDLHVREVKYALLAEGMVHTELREFNLRELGFTDCGKEVFRVDSDLVIKTMNMVADLVNDDDFVGEVEVLEL